MFNLILVIPIHTLIVALEVAVGFLFWSIGLLEWVCNRKISFISFAIAIFAFGLASGLIVFGE